jgi:ABC-2 type transport system permease protein
MSAGPAAPAGPRPGTAAPARPTPAHGSTAAAMHGRRWSPLRREWTKLMFQRRTYLIWGGMFLIPFLVSLAIKLAGTGPHGNGDGPAFLSRVLGNGMYVPLAALSALMPFLLPMAASMVGSYMIAGEAELGTLRIVLLRPESRGSLILWKWVAAMLYLAVGFALVFVGGFLFGAVFFGLHPMITLSGTTLSILHGVWLTGVVFLFGLAAMATMVSLAMLFSVITDSSLTALIATVIVYIVVNIVIAFSYFAWLKPWVFPNYYLEYVNFFRDPIYWRPIDKGLESFVIWSVAFVTAAYLLFRRKDVLS